MRSSIPFESLVRWSESPVFNQVDVVIGEDPASHRLAIFYGKNLLQRLVEADAVRDLSVLQVELNFADASDEPEQLAAFCLDRWGRCDVE